MLLLSRTYHYLFDGSLDFLLGLTAGHSLLDTLEYHDEVTCWFCCEDFHDGFASSNFVREPTASESGETVETESLEYACMKRVLSVGIVAMGSATLIPRRS
jgi:hypothetical protein